MKKALFILFTIIAITGCSKGPEYAAKNFSENMAKGNIEEAKKYATASTGRILDMIAGFRNDQTETIPDYKFKMVKDSIVGDSIAWVTYNTPEGSQDVLKLKKEDGKWKVYMGK